MTADEWIDRLIEALREHGKWSHPYIDSKTGCIDGYFDLRAVAEEMLQEESETAKS